jgi:hypothetical protein
VKAFVVVIAAFTPLMLAGCQHAMTLEEAQAACAKKGGFLVVIYTQKVTLTETGPEIASPGDCISPDKFADKFDFDSIPPAPNTAPAR